MTENASADRMRVEQWWPRLSIQAKHRILAALEDAGEGTEVSLDDETVRAISEAGASGEAPRRLTAHECDYIRTQTEFID